MLIHMMQFESGKEPAEEFCFQDGRQLDVAKLATAANVRALVLTHIGAAIDRPGTRERLIVEMAREYAGTIIWGEDLMTLTIGSA